MVLGRILYNNIKEYTPKWYPTIPYSQAVKPTFSTFSHLSQEDSHKSSQASTPAPTSSLLGESSPEYSNTTRGCGRFSFSVWLSPCTTQSTLHLWPFINQITSIEHTRLRWPRKRLTRRNSDNLKKLKEEANDSSLTFCNPTILSAFNIFKSIQFSSSMKNVSLSILDF